jgi:hypothetical protein
MERRRFGLALYEMLCFNESVQIFYVPSLSRLQGVCHEWSFNGDETGLALRFSTRVQTSRGSWTHKSQIVLRLDFLLS